LAGFLKARDKIVRGDYGKHGERSEIGQKEELAQDHVQLIDIVHICYDDDEDDRQLYSTSLDTSWGSPQLVDIIILIEATQAINRSMDAGEIGVMK